MKRLLGFAVLLSVFLSGFGVVGQPDRLSVVASFSILADVVENVTLGRADVVSLIPIGADPHSYEPSARDFAALSEADIIFVVGGGFEEQLLDAIASAATDVPVVEVSACVPVRLLGEGEEGDHADEDHADAGEDHAEDEHSDEAEADDHRSVLGLDLHDLCESHDLLLAEVDALKEAMELPSARVTSEEHAHRFFEMDCSHDDHSEESAAEDAHAHGACDPHVWSDPRNVSYWALLIGDVLSAVDPVHAEQYAANAREYAYAIDDLVRLQLEPELAAIPQDERLVLTNHETLGYFADAYGFNVVGFVMPGGSTLAEPSAQDLAALIDLVRSSGVKAIFVETTVSSRVAEQVAAETGVPIVSLYTDSLSEADGPAATYLDYVAYNFKTITDALSR